MSKPSRTIQPKAGEIKSPRVVSSPSQRRALGVFALASIVALACLARPVGSGLFLGTLLAFSLLRVYERLAARLKRPTLVAVILAVGSGVAIIGGIVLLLYFVVARGIVAANAIAGNFDPGGQLRSLLTRLGEATRHTPLGAIDVASRLRDGAAQAASKLTSWAEAVFGATFSAMLMLFFTVMTTFFVLEHWVELVVRAERMLPIHPMHTRVVLAEFQKVGKEVFIGTMLTGVAQGLLAGVGYAVGGVPEAALLGAITAICSLVPAIGTLLVWVPVGIALVASRHLAAGIFELAWGAIVVVIASDYVIRPRLVGGHGHVPTLLTFISLFGGVEVFGLIGLVIGPVIASVALAFLRTYDREEAAVGQKQGEVIADPKVSPEEQLAEIEPEGR